MTVPNELIGCIIGKGGSKIAEIRCLPILPKVTNIELQTFVITNICNYKDLYLHILHFCDF
jgi:hypothetical protein